MLGAILSLGTERYYPYDGSDTIAMKVGMGAYGGRVTFPCQEG